MINVRALVAEAVGTFVLIGLGSLGVASAVIVGVQGSGPVLVILFVPFAFGLGLMAAIAIAGDVSGGHFNPAVTLAAVLDNRISWTTGLAYAVAQAVGAFAASLFILLVLSADFVRATVNQPGPIGASTLEQDLHAFAVEIVLTAIFVAVILTITAKRPQQSLFVIPLTLVVIHYAGIPVSGASVNPVRSLAPAVVSGTYDGLWVYLTAPFLGAIIGWGLFRLFNPSEEDASLDDDEYEDDDLDDDEDDEELEPA
jgi:MIP family channel proteins